MDGLSGSARAGPRHYPHRTHEAEALARQCLDEALFLAVIADRAAGCIEAGRQRRVGNDAALPYG
jgi:hypothetical protein